MPDGLRVPRTQLEAGSKKATQLPNAPLGVSATTVKTIVLHYPDVLGAHSASPPRPYASAYV